MAGGTLPVGCGGVWIVVDARGRRDAGPANDGGSTRSAGDRRVIVCVASSPSVDKLFEVERVEVGAIHRPLAFTQVPGGKGLNVARAAHSLGAEVRATGILAGHTGRWLDEALAAEGVPGV